jgi:hypothetical protein
MSNRTDSQPSSPGQESVTPHSILPHLTSLMRHFSDLRDGVHGDAVNRRDKEARFAHEVDLLSPVARQALNEVNSYLLLESGDLIETGLQRSADGGLDATWKLSWPEQRTARVPPIVLYAYFGSGFHHPHLRGGTVGDWPLNLLNTHDAVDQLPILRAIATSDLHNLVFQADFRIVPAVMRSSTEPPGMG